MPRLPTLAALAVLAVLSLTGPAAAQTVVTLGFDDGPQSQLTAQTLLDQHGMKATFFINSGKVGHGPYMTWAQIDGLAADGMEIGGHTVDHPRLATLTADQQRAEICDDRTALLAHGYAVSDFAYPHNSYDGTTKALAQECGYDSARTVSGLDTPFCGVCAETIPPLDPYATRAITVMSTDSVADMESWIADAEQSGGGWVQLVLHDVMVGGDEYAITPDKLAAFLDWLAPRAASGTVVRTTADVVGGAVQPPPGPPAPPPPDPSNALPNPGMEADANADGMPDCFEQRGYGSNTRGASRVADAHGGSFGEQVRITAYSDGDQKLTTQLGKASCVSAAAPGDQFRVSAWYEASVRARLVVYLRTGTDSWRRWTDGPWVPATDTWTQATLDTSALPADTTAIGFGMAIESVGTLTLDDFAMGRLGGAPPPPPPPADTTPPAVALTAPADGATVSGATTLSADASDDVGVAEVDFLVDGAVVATDTTAPYAATWTPPTGTTTATIAARASDAAGNAATSAPRTVTVAAPPPVTNLLPNASLELDANADGMPDCYEQRGYGTNGRSASRVSDAHSGSWAEQLQITSFTDGDQKISSQLFKSGCTVTPVVGHRYQLSAWYKGTSRAFLVAYLSTGPESWARWTTGPTLPAADGWTLATWTTPPIPSGTVGLGFAIGMDQVGTLTVDDVGLADAGGS